MGGLKPKESFVGNGIKNKKHPRNWKVLVSAIILLLIASSVMVGVFASSSGASESEFPYLGNRAVQQDLGSGYKNPQVVALGNYFVAGTINYGKITMTFINATDGTIYKATSPAQDGNSKYFQIATDSNNKVVLVAWLNTSDYINGTFLSIDSSGNIVKTDNFTIATDVGTTLFGLSYGYGKFMIVWSDSGNHNHGRMIVYNTADPNNPTLEAIFDISADTHSHADNFVAYDNTTKHFLVLWRNYSGVTGKYNITGKLFDKDGNAITSDFLVANGFAAATKYDYPSADGGHGEFFVAYINYNSPYDIHGIYVNASTGEVGNAIDIGTSAKYGVSVTGVAFNGNEFIVDWTNESYDIVAMTYDMKGNALLSQPLVISNTTDSEEWQDVAYNNETNTYYFVWYDYTAKHDYGSLWTSSEIPEFSTFLPILIVAVVAFIAIKRRH